MAVWLGDIVYYSKMKKARWIEDIEVLQEKMAELECAEAVRLSVERASKRIEEESRKGISHE